MLGWNKKVKDKLRHFFSNKMRMNVHSNSLLFSTVDYRNFTAREKGNIDIPIKIVEVSYAK